MDALGGSKGANCDTGYTIVGHSSVSFFTGSDRAGRIRGIKIEEAICLNLIALFIGSGAGLLEGHSSLNPAPDLSGLTR